MPYPAGLAQGTDPIDRFLQKFVANDEGCWNWTAKRKGRASHWSGKKYVTAARYSYELFVGPIPEGRDVCHHCDNPRCVRPDHLFTGTAKDNVADMVRKGRHRGRERHPMAKLNWASVRDIRSSDLPAKRLAAKYTVCEGTIYSVLRGDIWRT